MTRPQIEAMTPDGTGYDANLPGPIPDSRWHKYRDTDGTGYVLLDNAPKYKVGSADGWTDWKDLD